MIQILWQDDHVELVVELALDVMMLRERIGRKKTRRGGRVISKELL